MKQYSTSLATGLLSLLLLLGSCKKEIGSPLPGSAETGDGLAVSRPDDPGFAGNDMVMYWNEKTATVLGSPMTQPTRTRYFAMVEIAVHDALNAIKPKYQRFALQEREQFANPGAAVASAAYWTIKGLNRHGTFPVDSWYNESLATIPDGESKELGIQLGKHAADAIIANRADDGFTQVVQAATSPADGVEPGRYRSPLTLVNGLAIYLQPALKYVPNWGQVMKPYVLQSNHQVVPPGPYALTDPAYTADFNEVKEKGARVNSTRTETESLAARFWSENRPSITWNNFTRAAIQQKKLDAWKTARLFALIHTSLAESINTSLDAAYYYYFWRPETAIRLADGDNNSSTGADPAWMPFVTEVPNRFPTPPQPGYPSTYAAYGGSSAEIMKLFFGSDNTSIGLSSLTLPGTVREFNSFTQAARDNTLSLVYMGWDFRKSAMDGEEMGRSIARYVFEHQFKED